MLCEDGSECAADEPGELVHRGPLVGLGYWGDAEKTAERYRLLPAGIGGRESGLQLPEYAVYSGDTVRRDAEGFLYFIGRRDEMIKTSGYRVSPAEVEEVLYATKLVGECAPPHSRQIHLRLLPNCAGCCYASASYRQRHPGGWSFGPGHHCQV